MYYDVKIVLGNFMAALVARKMADSVTSSKIIKLD
jgi:hypothetical protein